MVNDFGEDCQTLLPFDMINFIAEGKFLHNDRTKEDLKAWIIT
jgi:hypothetical protein